MSHRIPIRDIGGSGEGAEGFPVATEVPTNQGGCKDDSDCLLIDGECVLKTEEDNPNPAEDIGRSNPN